MSIEALNSSSGALSHAQDLLSQGPQDLQEFEKILEQAQQQGGPELVQQAANQDPKVNMTTPAEQESLLAQQIDEAKKPGGIENLLGQVEDDYSRLEGLIDKMQGGETFRPQELLGLQAEVNKISLHVETTVKVISEVVQNVKQLMQQQI